MPGGVCHERTGARAGVLRGGGGRARAAAGGIERWGSEAAGHGGEGLHLTPQQSGTPIEDLNLSMRGYNCLRRSGLITVGQVLECSEEDLLSLRNLGRQAYDDLRDKLTDWMSLHGVN